MRSKSFIVISIALLSLIAIEKSDAQVSTTNFTTSGSGWYRLGGWTAGVKRGAERVVISLSGGNHTPQSVVIDAYKNWSTGLHLDAKGIRNDQIEAVRIVSDGGIYYVEAYFDRAIINSGYIYLYHIEGYQNGFTINSGALPTGAGTVEIDTGDIQSENQFGNDIRTRKGLVVDGNVGIGTTTPDNKLDVKGTIRAEEVKVETGWADYVFHEDYELKSLSEVSTYIQENHHLPGIPTAAEVAENGIKLGEMNAKLLEKIEELTLYQIELLEKLEAMNERIKQLEQDK